MTDYNKLVEQAREAASSEWSNVAANHVRDLLAGLADAVERLQELNKRLETEANKHRDIASEAIGRMTDAEHREKKLTDGIREHERVVRQQPSPILSGDADLRLWSLLDVASDDKRPWRNNDCPHGYGFDDCCHDPNECRDESLDEIVRISEEVGLYDDPVPYRALEGSEGGEDDK